MKSVDESTEREIAEFVAGRRTKLKLGGYGGTVTLTSEGTRIKVERTKPTRSQRRINDNSRKMRQTVVEQAQAFLAKVRERSPRTPNVAAEPEAKAKEGAVSVRRLWLTFLRHKVDPDLPDEVLNWGRAKVDAFLAELTPAARANALSPTTFSSVTQAARTLHRDEVAPLPVDIGRLEPAALRAWGKRRLNAGGSAQTVETYLGRLAAAVSHFKNHHPTVWGDRHDPIKPLDPFKKGIKGPPEVREAEARALVQYLAGTGQWRVLGAVLLAWTSGRRIGELAGSGWAGAHLDALPLRAADFFKEDGELRVVYRAEAGKGKHYGRGDEIVPATEMLAATYEWLLGEHPNPRGPEYPLIWSEEDPTRPEPYHRLREGFDQAWRVALGTRRPKGLAWHGFCRGTITTIADELGVQAAAEYTGRSPETAARVYKRTRLDQQQRIGAHLDEGRRDVLTVLAGGKGDDGEGA